MIVYDKLWELVDKYNLTRAWLRENGIMGNATYEKVRSGAGHLDGKSINRLCIVFQCQPGDLFEYVPSPDDEVVPKAADAKVRQRGRPPKRLTGQLL